MIADWLRISRGPIRAPARYDFPPSYGMPRIATSRSAAVRWCGRRMNVAIWEKRGDLKASIGRNGWVTPRARAGSAPGLRRVAGGHGRPRRSAKEVGEGRLEIRDRHPDLTQPVPVADRHPAVARLALLGVADGLHVHRHAVRRADLVLAAVEAADRRRVVIHGHPAPGGEPIAELPAPGHDLLPLLEER